MSSIKVRAEALGRSEEDLRPRALSSVTPAAPGERLHLLDSLRGFAALAVLLPHASGLFEPGLRPWLQLGALGVPVFFVLSGFVIARSLGDEPLGASGFGRFLLRRSVRLDPPYWAAIAFALAVAGFRRWAVHGPALPDLAVVGAHLAYLQGVLGFGEPINAVFWTLCLELQFYALYAALRVRLGRDHPVLPALLFLVLASSLGLSLSSRFGPSPWFASRFYLFIAGALVEGALAGRQPRWVTPAAAALLVGALLATRNLELLTALATAALLLVAGRRDALRSWLAHPRLTGLGRSSYSFYLVHVPVVAVVLGVRTRVHAAVPALGWLALCYALSLVAAQVLYRVVEAPAQRWARAWVPLRPKG